MSNIFEKLGVSEKPEKTTSLYQEAFSDELKAIYERLVEIYAMKVVWHQGEISKAQKDLQHYEQLLGKSNSQPTKTIKTSKAFGDKFSVKARNKTAVITDNILQAFARRNGESIPSNELLGEAKLDRSHSFPYAAFQTWLNGKAKGNRFVTEDKSRRGEGEHWATCFWKLTEEGKRKLEIK
jgi:hypothetical protein